VSNNPAKGFAGEVPCCEAFLRQLHFVFCIGLFVGACRFACRGKTREEQVRDGTDYETRSCPHRPHSSGRSGRASPSASRWPSSPTLQPRVKTVCSVVALTYRATVDVPARFRKSKADEAVFGLTCAKYQSGEVDRSGRISRCGDEMMRVMLYEAVIYSTGRGATP
jgi:hypothetical protein